MRTSIRLESSEAPTFNLQPFYALQLDIQSPGVHSVEDALRENFTSERIDGYICPRTGRAAEVEQTGSLEELPPVLVLHLKRMVYDGATGGCQKVVKMVFKCWLVAVATIFYRYKHTICAFFRGV